MDPGDLGESLTRREILLRCEKIFHRKMTHAEQRAFFFLDELDLSEEKGS
jgi:hypothetical protein